LTRRQPFRILLLKLSTIEHAMATVNFSVPDDVKKAFDKAFKDRNKSAVIAELMRRAVTEAEQTKLRAELFRRLTEDRGRRPKIADEAARRARATGRP
jgi:hypothetical protein